MKLFYLRLIAWLIDNAIILGYATLLFLVTVTIDPAALESVEHYNPWRGEFIGLITLTLPVIALFTWMERSEDRQTIGKRLMKIHVRSEKNYHGFLKRNLLKFLPWEIGHFSVHQFFYFNSTGSEPPLWLWFVLSSSYLLLGFYGISAWLNLGEMTWYDAVSHTRIQRKRTEHSSVVQ